jgi:hypothetical protein
MDADGKRGGGRMRGSYTIEAALLMTIVIPVLTGILYLGFYLHNCALLKCAAYETAVYASLYGEKEECRELVERRSRELISGRLLGTRGVSGNTLVEEDRVTVQYKGQMQLPGLVMRYTSGSVLEIKGSASLALLKPGSTVVRLRSLEKIAEEMRK